MSWPKVLMMLLLAATSVGHASVTVAWKMPVERVAPSFAESLPLAKPPGDSAFFQAGDKLWDLSKKMTWRVPDETKVEGEVDPFAENGDGQVEVDWKGDWLVWNSRSGMIVARGSWHDVLVAEQVLGCDELPKVIRARIEVKGSGKPRSMSLVSRSGEMASLEMDGLRAEVEPVSSSDGDVIDSPFRVSWPAEDGRGSWDVKTAVSLPEGSPCRVASHGTKGQGWELVVATERELLDGTPWKQFRWLETADGLKPWPGSMARRLPLRKQLDADRWLTVYPTYPGFTAYLLRRTRLKPSPDLHAPAELAEWVRSPLVNLRPLCEDQGVVLQNEKHFAGIDPVSNTAFVVTDHANQDRAEGLFSIIDGWVEPPIWIETNPESGGWGLASRSGEAAEIRRSCVNPTENLLFRSEPTQGADGLIFDLRYSLDMVAGGVKLGELKANTILTKDKPQVVGSGTAPDGKEVKVIVTASHPFK